MSDEEAIATFTREVAAHAASLPVRESAAFLRGALALTGDRAEVQKLRDVYQPLKEAESEFARIESEAAPK